MIRSSHPSNAHTDDLVGLLIGTLGALCIWLAGSWTSLQTIPPNQWATPNQGLLRSFDGQHWINQSNPLPPLTQNPLVILVHGLDEPGGIWDQLAPALHQAGYQVLRFDYPNDQAVSISAQSMFKHMTHLSDTGITRASIIAHSMGGLVTRQTLTSPTLANSTGSIANIHIDRLILVGTPNYGSPWATLRAVAEAREHLQRWLASDNLDPAILLNLSHDGDGQAGKDLLPGSTFLTTLNQRPMPPSTTVTCIVGRVIDPLTTQSNTTLDQAANALGDAVVSVDSASLLGCKDIVLLVANHRSMLRTIELQEGWNTMIGSTNAPQPQAIPIILNRLNTQTNTP